MTDRCYFVCSISSEKEIHLQYCLWLCEICVLYITVTLQFISEVVWTTTWET